MLCDAAKKPEREKRVKLKLLVCLLRRQRIRFLLTCAELDGSFSPRDTGFTHEARWHANHYTQQVYNQIWTTAWLTSYFREQSGKSSVTPRPSESLSSSSSRPCQSSPGWSS